MASVQMWVVAICFKGVEVIGAFIDFLRALPDGDHLLLMDD